MKWWTLKTKAEPLLLQDIHVPDRIRIEVGKGPMVVMNERPDLPANLYHVIDKSLYYHPDDELLQWFHAVDPKFKSKVSLLTVSIYELGLDLPSKVEFAFADATLAQMYKLAWS